MEIFYKGEDIALTIELFADGSLAVPVPIDQYIVDIVFYTSGDKQYIHASTNDTAGANVKIVLEDDNVIKCVLSKTLLDSLDCGQVNMEIRLKSIYDQLSRIVKSYAFILQDSVIKTI